MENNENLVAEQAAENVEVATEQPAEQNEKEPEKTYTEAEFNAKLDEVLGKKIARRDAKIRKEYNRKYGELESVLRAGTGKESVEELTSAFKDFYQKKGINIPSKADMSEKDIEILARAEADDIIRSGFDEVIYEVNRLSEVGADNMTAREKAVFKALAEHRQNTERNQEFAKLGVTEDVYNSKEFREFAGKFNSNTPSSDIVNIYNKIHQKKEFKTIGSMKNSTSDDGTVKDFYTRDEALKFTKKDFDKNPALFKAVEQSMLKW